jgi:predicted HicB family RNase H-like nuclease
MRQLKLDRNITSCTIVHINKGETLKDKEKRLVLEMPEVLHNEIKSRAAFRGQSIKEWVLMAIMDQIRKEKKYE